MEHRQTRAFLQVSVLIVAAGVWAALAFSGCGKSSDEALVSNSYRYQATVDGCDTGAHEFSSLSEFCKGLQDEKLNHLCAQSARKGFFNERACPGSFTPKY